MEMSHEATQTSAPSQSSNSGDRHIADALGAMTDFEKSIQGLKKLYEERKEIESKLVEVQSRLVANETELASRSVQLEQALAKQSEIEKTVELLRSESEAAAASRAEVEAQLDTLRSELETRTREHESLKQQEAERQRRDAERREQEAKQHEAQQREQEAERQRLEAEQREREEAARKEQEARAAANEAEAEKSKSLAKELDEFASELQSLQSDLEREKAELEATRASLRESARALKEREAEIESQKAEQSAAFAARQSEIDARAEEVFSAHRAAEQSAAGDAELGRRLEAETQASEQLRQDIERVARRCAAQEEVLTEYEQLLAVERTHVHALVGEIQAGDADPEVTRTRIDELKACLSNERAERDRLQRRLTELQNAPKATGAARHPSPSGLSALRQRRLKRCRAILREHVSKVRKASEVLAKRFEQCEQVLSQRAQLAQAKRQLDVASAAIARRAGAKRAGAITLCIVLTLGVLGALSWAVVGQAWPGDFEARADITADGRGRELSDGELDEWRRALEATLSDPQFAETVATRMKQRGYDSLGNAGAVRTLLTGSFSHESPVPGTLSLELRAPGKEKAARTLDIITTALASDANAARERRADGAVTLIKGPAISGTQPINDQRLPRSGMVLLGSIVLTCGLGFGIWGKLSRAKQEFELGSQIDQVLDDAKWSEFTAATTVGRPNAGAKQ